MSAYILFLFLGFSAQGDAKSTLREFYEFKIGIGPSASSWKFEKCETLKWWSANFSDEPLSPPAQRLVNWKLRRFEIGCREELKRARREVLTASEAQKNQRSSQKLQMDDHYLPTAGGQLQAASGCDRIL